MSPSRRLEIFIFNPKYKELGNMTEKQSIYLNTVRGSGKYQIFISYN